MSTEPVQGFESLLVLHKLGYDLQDTLRGTTEAPVPADLVERAKAIPDVDTGHDVLLLHSTEFRALNDELI